uniref:KIB1-4 beta-propeller domain-containing protein n=1 Tax=Oryza glumipatula TaxID=40148 RepID=A0A0E0A354_9ORYZ
MDVSPAPPWAELPDAVLLGIVRRIPCAFDRAHVGEICRSWRRTLLQIPPPRPLPGILLLTPHGPTLSFVVAGDAWCTHPVFVPEAFRRARYFGSYDDSWLFLAVGQDNGHALFNLTDSQEEELPNWGTFQLHDRELEAEILLVAATLSSSPNVHGSVAGGILTADLPPANSMEHIAFWRTGSDVMSKTIRTSGVGLLEDVAYHDEAFHFLTLDDIIVVCRASMAEPWSPGKIVVVDEVNVSIELGNIAPRDELGYRDLRIVASYLVESRNDLLMVEKLAPNLLSPASAFRVFQMIKERLHDGQVHYSWEELTTKLDGRMLFVGQGCSRSYEAANYPGLDAGVYFLDDRSTRHDPKIPFQEARARRYLCSDNGKWSGTPPQIKLCVPDPGPSNHSPPVWLFP